MGDDGNLLDSGVPAALVTAWLGRHGIVPTRTTDFQIMFLFSMGITRGKWGTLINTLCSFKRHYDSNAPLSQVMPELANQYPDIYGSMGVHDLGDKMFAWLKTNNPGASLNAAYASLPEAMMTHAMPIRLWCLITSKWSLLKNCKNASPPTPSSRIRREFLCCSPGKTLVTVPAHRLLIFVLCSPGIMSSLVSNMKPKVPKLLMVFITLCA